MKKVLIICPRFAPASSPDQHRARMMLHYCRDHGWDPTLLSVQPDEVDAPMDPDLESTLPADVPVLRLRGIPKKFFNLLGFGNLPLRILPALLMHGTREIRRCGFDLIFFSTSAAPVFMAGVYWKWRFNVPFIIDLQDPVTTDYYRKHSQPPPGGAWKFRLGQLLGTITEKLVFPRVDGIISVSDEIVEQIQANGKLSEAIPRSTIPFSASRRDLDCARSAAEDKSAPPVGKMLYLGAGGPFMEYAARGLIRAAVEVSRSTDPQTLSLIGTSYSPAGKESPVFSRIISEEKGDSLVSEHPSRLPYIQSLKLLSRANQLVILGSTEPHYNPSKLLNYLLSGKPLLTLPRRQSAFHQFLLQIGGSVIVPFDPDEPIEAFTRSIIRDWFQLPLNQRSRPVNEEGIARYEAEAMTEKICRFFDRIHP
jgi:hypothetical protein